MVKVVFLSPINLAIYLQSISEGKIYDFMQHFLISCSCYQRLRLLIWICLAIVGHLYLGNFYEQFVNSIVGTLDYLLMNWTMGSRYCSKQGCESCSNQSSTMILFYLFSLDKHESKGSTMFQLAYFLDIKFTILRIPNEYLCLFAEQNLRTSAVLPDPAYPVINMAPLIALLTYYLLSDFQKVAQTNLPISCRCTSIPANQNSSILVSKRFIMSDTPCQPVPLGDLSSTTLSRQSINQI